MTTSTSVSVRDVCLIGGASRLGACFVTLTARRLISARLFATLPLEEKHLWHSHVYEVRSGQLIAPGIPEVAERELMRKIASTYGKTWHTWHTDQNQTLPLGTPM